MSDHGLTADQRAELERRGSDGVRALLQSGRVGPSRASLVTLGAAGVDDPTRGAVEDWLRDQGSAAEKLAAERHVETMRVARSGRTWAVIAGVVSIGALAVSVLAWWFPR
jgi:hypothetical protein